MKHEVVVGHRANPSALNPTAQTNAVHGKSIANSVPKFNQNSTNKDIKAQISQFNHKTGAVTEKSQIATGTRDSSGEPAAANQVKHSRAYHQYMPDSSDSDSDDVLSVSWSPRPGRGISRKPLDDPPRLEAEPAKHYEITFDHVRSLCVRPAFFLSCHSFLRKVSENSRRRSFQDTLGQQIVFFT